MLIARKEDEGALVDAMPEKTEHNHSDTLQCAQCNDILPSYARYCGICGESLRASIEEDTITRLTRLQRYSRGGAYPRIEEDTIPRLPRLRPSGVEQYISNTRVSSGLLWSWQMIIILSAVAAALVVLVFPDSPLRPIVVMWFLFICPGMMLVRFLRLNQPVVEWVLALALSLAIDAIVSGIVLYVGKWSPAAILSIIIGLSIAGAITQLAISNQKSA